MNNIMYFCTKCNQNEISEIKTINEQYIIKGESIDVQAKVRYCAKCGEELYDFELEQETIMNAYNSYRKNHDLLLPVQIKKIREKYGLAASSFSKLLGFGEKTITRYENGALQDKAQNNLIVLMENIYAFKKLWERNKTVLSHKEIDKIDRFLESMHPQNITLSYTIEPISDYKFVPSVKNVSTSNSGFAYSMQH